MIHAFLLVVGAATTEVRTLEIVGILDTNGTTTLTRTINEKGEMTFTANDQWGKDDSWTESLTQTQKAELIRYSMKWKKPNGKDAEWRASDVGGQVIWKTEQYEGISYDGGERKIEFTPAQVGDPTLFWGIASAPKAGDMIERQSFVPLLGYLKETIKSLGESTLSIDGQSFKTTKLERTRDSLTLIVYIDEKGMPIRREYYSKGSTRAHRVDTLRTKR